MPSAIIKCPFPFPDIEAITSVKIYQEIESKYEGPKSVLIYEGIAIYDQSSKNVFNADSKQIALSGSLIIKGEIKTIGDTLKPQGYVKIGDDTRQIYKMSKPTIMGVVYSTEIDLL